MADVVQCQQRDGSWRDWRRIGYKPIAAAQNVAHRRGVRTRVVDRRGRVVWDSEHDGVIRRG